MLASGAFDDVACIQSAAIGCSACLPCISHYSHLTGRIPTTCTVTCKHVSLLFPLYGMCSVALTHLPPFLPHGRHGNIPGCLPLFLPHRAHSHILTPFSLPHFPPSLLHASLRRHNSIVLRLPFFQAHDVHFLIRLTPAQQRPKNVLAPQPSMTPSKEGAQFRPASACSEAHNWGGAQGQPASHGSHTQIQQLCCWRVPLHLQGVPWLQLARTRAAELTDHLVLPGGSYTCEGG